MKKLLKSNFSKLAISLILIASVFTINIKTSATIQKQDVGMQFRGNTATPGVTDSKMPINSSDITELWKAKHSDGRYIGSPVVVGDYIYVASGKKLRKVNKHTGEFVMETDLKGSIGFFSQVSYGDGKIFVPIQGPSRIQAFDAETLESLWVSASEGVNTSLQSLSPVVYSNGYVYMGTTNSSASEGLFFALSTEDEDKSTGDEIKEFTWSYIPSEGSKGFYWSAAAITENAAIFGGENGQIVSHSLTEDKVIDKIQVDGAIRSTAHYNKDNNRVYVSTKSGYIHSVKVNNDGTLDKSSLKSTKIGSDITSSPVTYNGRLYVGGGGILSTAGFSVLDADSLEIIYQINGITSQSSPILTTVYASEENNNEVYLYALEYGGYKNGGYIPDVIYCIKDFEGNKTPNYTKLIAPSSNQYNSSSILNDDDGNIYFKNDSNYLFAFKNLTDGKYSSQDVINAINRLPKNIKSGDEYEVSRVRFRFNKLSSVDKDNVSNIGILNKAEKRLESLKDIKVQIENINRGIESIPDEITLEHKELIEGLYASYTKLSDEDRLEINNNDKLISAKKKIDLLVIDNDISTAEESINNLPELKDIVLDEELNVNRVYNSYMELKEEFRDKVSNREKLFEAKEVIEKSKKIVEDINDDIWNKINPSNITIEDKEVINSIISRYESIDSRDKKYVKYYEEVLAARDKVAELEKNNEDSGTIDTTRPDERPVEKPVERPTEEPVKKPVERPVVKNHTVGGTSTNGNNQKQDGASEEPKVEQLEKSDEVKENSNNEESKSENNAEESSEKKNSNKSIIYIVIGLAVIVVGIGALVLINKKRD